MRKELKAFISNINFLSLVAEFNSFKQSLLFCEKAAKNHYQLRICFQYFFKQYFPALLSHKKFSEEVTAVDVFSNKSTVLMLTDKTCLHNQKITLYDILTYSIKKIKKVWKAILHSFKFRMQIVGITTEQ